MREGRGEGLFTQALRSNIPSPNPSRKREGSRSGQPERRAIGVEDRVLLLPGMGLHLPQPDDHPHDLGVVAVGLGLGIDVADVVRDALLLFLETLDPLDKQPQLIGRDGAFRQARKLRFRLSAGL